MPQRNNIQTKDYIYIFTANTKECRKQQLTNSLTKRHQNTNATTKYENYNYIYTGFNKNDKNIIFTKQTKRVLGRVRDV